MSVNVGERPRAFVKPFASERLGNTAVEKNLLAHAFFFFLWVLFVAVIHLTESETENTQREAACGRSSFSTRCSGAWTLFRCGGRGGELELECVVMPSILDASLDLWNGMYTIRGRMHQSGLVGWSHTKQRSTQTIFCSCLFSIILPACLPAYATMLRICVG